MTGSLLVGRDFTDRSWHVGCAVDALAAKLTGTTPPEEARDYYDAADFAFLARLCLFARDGSDRGRSTAAVISDALAHHSGDFTSALANVANKVLGLSYANAQPAFKLVAREMPFKNFRPHRIIDPGSFPSLLKVNEHGEFQSGSLSDSSESITAATYGRILDVTRSVLVNDDVEAFGQVLRDAALRIADFEDATFFATCIAPNSGLGPDLSDAAPVFDATHANITGAGALDATLLGSARSILKSQVSPDGIKLNAQARVLLVPPASESLAEGLVADLAPAQSDASQLRVAADANLSGTRFYLFASPEVLPVFVHGRVLEREPRVEPRTGFHFDGVQFKLVDDFACGAIGYRGAVTGAGA